MISRNQSWYRFGPPRRSAVELGGYESSAPLVPSDLPATVDDPWNRQGGQRRLSSRSGAEEPGVDTAGDGLRNAVPRQYLLSAQTDF